MEKECVRLHLAQNQVSSVTTLTDTRIPLKLLKISCLDASFLPTWLHMNMFLLMQLNIKDIVGELGHSGVRKSENQIV